jgi:cobalt/nickel transport protein
MAESKTIYIAGFAIIALLVVAVLAYGASQDWEFGGADDGAEGVVEEVDPDYEPWWNGIFGDYELPGETEGMLFALQAAIGAIIIGYFIGAYTRKE